VHHYNSFTRTRITDRTWRHDVIHRRGVPYHDPGVRVRFGQGPLPGAGAREPFRGRVQPAPKHLTPGAAGGRTSLGTVPRVGVTRQQPSLTGPQAPRITRPPAAFEGLGRGGEMRSFSNRGRTSRMGAAPARPAPSAPKAAPGGGRGVGGAGGRK
jgi:hypothetical protein